MLELLQGGHLTITQYFLLALNLIFSFLGSIVITLRVWIYMREREAPKNVYPNPDKL